MSRPPLGFRREPGPHFDALGVPVLRPDPAELERLRALPDAERVVDVIERELAVSTGLGSIDTYRIERSLARIATGMSHPDQTAEDWQRAATLLARLARQGVIARVRPHHRIDGARRPTWRLA